MSDEPTIPLSPRAILVTIARYGVKDCDGNIITQEAAMSLFDDLCMAATINRERPRGTNYHVVDVGMEGDENSGSVYAWVDSVTKKGEA